MFLSSKAASGLRRRALVLGVAARSWLAAGAGGLAALGGCSLQADADHRGPDAPDRRPWPQPLAAPGVAWVFSSGGPRGFVHVGVLKALDELKLQPALLVGASIGTVVGALYAAGRSGREIEQLALDLKPWTLGRLAVGSSERFSGSAIAALVRRETGVERFEQLKRPLLCVVQRLVEGAAAGGGQAQAFNHGDLGLAVQAACAIEGQLAPVRIRGQRYGDADLVAPLPVRLARAAGARRTLAVDASAHEALAPPGAERYRAGDLRKRALTEPDARLADLLLHPSFGYYVSLSREFRERAIDAGYRATLAQAEALRRLHGLG